MTNTSMTSKARKRVNYGDWVISLVLLGVMIAAYLMSAKWPSNAAFFPELLSLAAILFLVLHLGILAWAAVSGRRDAAEAAGAVPKAAHSNGEVALVAEGDDDLGNENEFHNIFSDATKSMWTEAIGWMVLFFGGMYLFGLLVTLPIFTLAYLRVHKISWMVSVLYVLFTTGLIYAIFSLFLHLPLPAGIFPLFGE
jgi:hypothetical protein